LIVTSPLATSPQQPAVTVLTVDETISSSTLDAFKDALSYSRSVDAQALIIKMNTPGGSVDAMLKIIELIDNSEIPIVTYVYPKGARAWSAGTFILVASHIAAMAPDTVIGSAQPVSYSPFGGAEPVNDSKIVNALLEVIETHAESRGRNVTAARLFILENLNLNDREAFKYNVIDIRAENLQDLINKLDGFKVNTTAGELTLHTKGAKILEVEPSIRTSILRVISDPLIASLLLVIGVYALIFGLASPGHGGEIVGAIALLLGLIGLGFDVNLTAILLIALGAILLLYELSTPGFGFIGGSGIFSLTIGALLLGSISPTKWLIGREWFYVFQVGVYSVTLTIAAFFAVAIYKVVQVKRRKPVIGDIIGEVGEALEDLKPGIEAFVRVRGEYWKAKCGEEVKAGSKVVVVGKEGPILIVKPKK